MKLIKMEQDLKGTRKMGQRSKSSPMHREWRLRPEQRLRGDVAASKAVKPVKASKLAFKSTKGAGMYAMGHAMHQVQRVTLKAI